MKIIVKDVPENELSALVAKVLDLRCRYHHKHGDCRHYSESIQTLLTSPDVLAGSDDEIILTSVRADYLAKVNAWIIEKGLKNVTAYVPLGAWQYLCNDLKNARAVHGLETLFDPLRRGLRNKQPDGGSIIEESVWQYIPSRAERVLLKTHHVQINAMSDLP